MQKKRLVTNPLFSSFPAEEIASLLESLTIIAFPAGQILFQEGKLDDRFYILLDGQVEVIKELGTPDERVLGIRECINLLGEMSLFTQDGCHTASVRSLTHLRLIKMTRNDLEEMLHRHPQFAYEIIRLLCKRLDESENITIQDLKEKNRCLSEAYEELKRAQEQIIEKERLEKELEIAGQIQQSILPETLPSLPGYGFGALMIPARAVGGDFYTFIHLGKDRIGIVVGDVSDKGVPASLFMALTYSLIRAEAVRTRSPVKALYKVNQHLLQMNSSTMFVTLVYGILDYKRGEFHFARAGHPSPYVLDGEGRIMEVPVSPGHALGLFVNLPIDEQTIHIPPGGLILLYSDGVSDTFDEHGNHFGTDSIYQTVLPNRMLQPQDICGQLWQDVQAYGKDMPQQDDFTAVIIKSARDQ